MALARSRRPLGKKGALITFLLLHFAFGLTFVGVKLTLEMAARLPRKGWRPE